MPQLSDDQLKPIIDALAVAYLGEKTKIFENFKKNIKNVSGFDLGGALEESETTKAFYTAIKDLKDKDLKKIIYSS